MLNFFNSPAKRKDGKWLDSCGDSCVPWSRVTIQSLWWWQRLLLLFICLIGLTVWAEAQAMPASSPHSQTIHAGQIPQTLLQRSHFPDEQHSGTQVPFWKKKFLKTLHGNSHIPSVISTKQYKQNRLLKRELDNLSQNKSVSSSEFTSAMNEIIRHFFSGHVLSLWSPKVGGKSVAKNEISSTPSSVPVETLRNINVLRKDIILDDDMIETKPNISVSAQEIQVLSTQKYSLTSKQQNTSTGHPLNEEETKSQSTLSSESSDTALHYSSMPSNDRPHTEKSIHATDWRGDHFPVTVVSEVLTTNGSSDMVISTPLPDLTSWSDGYTKSTSNESSNYITKTFSTMEQHRDSVKATDTSNMSIVMPVHPPIQTTTVNTILTSIFEATSTGLQVDSSITVKSQTSSSLKKPTEMVYNAVYSSDMSSSPASTLLDSPHTFTSQKQDDRQLAPFASDAFRISALPSTRGTLEITSSSNPDHDTAVVHEMISTEGRMERSSLMVDSKSVNTLFALYNQFPQVNHDSLSTPLTNLHMSDIAATTEHGLNLGEQSYTGAPQDLSTWSALKQFSSTKEAHVSTDLEYYQTGYNVHSNVTSQPLTDLNISDIVATTEHELISGEQTYTGAPQDLSTWSALKQFSSSKEAHVSTDLEYYQTGYNVHSNVTSQPLTDLNISDIVATTEHELNSGEQTYTGAPQDLSTWSALKQFSSTKEAHVSTDLEYYQTGYNVHSNVTSQPLTDLNISDIVATTEHELNSGEQTYTGGPQDLSTWSALKKINSTEETNASSDIDYFQTDYKMPLNVTSQLFTNLHMSDIAATTEHELNSGEQTYTGAPQAFSTRSTLKKFVTTEESNASSDVDNFQTDYKMPLTVTSWSYWEKDNGTGILQGTDATVTQTPLTLSETTSFPEAIEITTYESDNTGLFTSIHVTLDEGTRSETPFTSNTFTSGHYPETVFTSTENPFPFQNDMFYDTVKENGNLVQTTQSPTTSPDGVSKSITYIKPQWNSETSQFDSTVSANPKWNLSQRSLYSTMAPLSFSDTKDHTTNFSYPSSLNVSLPARAEQETLHSTIMSAVMQITHFTEAALETSLPVKPSSDHPFMTTHEVSTTLSSTGKHLLQQTTTSPSQDYSISHQSPKSGTVAGSSSYETPRSVTGPSTSSMTSIFNLLVSTASSPPLVSTPFQSINGTTMAHTSSSSEPAKNFQTPDPRFWLPQSSTTFPPKPTSSVNSTNYISTSSLSTSRPLVVKMPMSFHLTGILYSKQLGDPTTDEYKRLEREVKLVMNKIFSTHYLQEYVQTELLEFLHGSVIVKSNVVFDNSFPTPSGSDIVRTVLSAVYGTNNYFRWNINGSTVESKGYTQNNLEALSLPISFLVLRVGYIAVSENYQDEQNFLDYLQKQVFQAVNVTFPIKNVSFSQIRDVHGDLEVRGILCLNSPVHINVQSLLSTLLPLINRSVDFSSVTVDGKLSELLVHSIVFRVINQPFVLKLLDMSSPESQILSKDLSVVVQSALHDSNPLQVIIREFKSGSVVCRGDLLYQLPAPGSKEILKLLLNSLGSDGILGSSSYKVDSRTIVVGDSSPGPQYEYVDFPGYGVAIIVICGLIILIFPALVYMCFKTKMFGHRNKATIQQHHDQDNQSHHFEMDNRAFRASIEQP